MKKYTVRIITGVLLLACTYLNVACEDIDDIHELNLDRILSPTGLSIRIRNSVNAEVSWNEMEHAKSYTLEVYEGGAIEGTPIRTVENILTNSYTISQLEGETSYSLQVKCVGDDIADSKWSILTFSTDAEQIFQNVAAEDLAATEVTLRWSAGQAATSIVLNPGDITHTVTDAEIAAGAATVTGLTGETQYTAVLLNGTKVRGTVSFTTPVDIGNATLVEPGDDLAAMIAAATEGEVFAIMPGEYTLGEFTPTTSFALKGVRPADKPIITGYFKIASTIASLELNAIILDGNNASRPFDGDNATCNISAITISDCEIRNYKSGFVYTNNSNAVFGTITINNSIIKNITGDGGDGFDFRAGTLGSLTVTNTTFDTGFRTFIRIQVSSNVTFRQCTFYKTSNFDNGNNHGLFRMSGGGTFEVSKCLFVETGFDGATGTKGNFCRQSGNMTATPTYSDNYYYNCHNLWAGLYTDPGACDATEADPGFVNAAEGDFTLTNEDLKYDQIGDQRWRQ